MTKAQTLLPPIVIASGIFLTILSGFYISSFLAILGITISFWGAILYYIKPTKYVPISFITAINTSNMDNLNRLFTELKYTQKSIYLPPNKLSDPESSIIFIPQTTNKIILTNNETTNTLFTTKKDGMLLTPPGYGLIKIMEQKLGSSFTKMDLIALQKQLPHLLIEELGIAENISIQVENNQLTIEITGSIFTTECNQAQKYPQIHGSIGCILTSALACALSKVTGKPVTINAEETIGKTTKITYHFLEE
ncbi:MAG: hypothetical protein LBQ98_04245 [Nitrososphaerota archaeon]|jgi:hypothetical protein|nr:hypothetical protein [Nitrososphaerota archaeon]